MPSDVTDHEGGKCLRIIRRMLIYRSGILMFYTNAKIGSFMLFFCSEMVEKTEVSSEKHVDLKSKLSYFFSLGSVWVDFNLVLIMVLWFTRQHFNHQEPHKAWKRTPPKHPITIMSQMFPKFLY